LPLVAQDAAPAPEKGLLAGKVLNSATGEPVRKAHVALMDMGAAQKGKPESPGGGSVFTDAEGRFQFTTLAPGSYALVASREGFDTPNVHGEPKLLRVTLARDEEKSDMVIHLMPLGAISGRILDEDGDAIRQMEVQAMSYQYSATGRRGCRRVPTP
jgi:protocatechuate 3,4-dioxygenase beta subunit